MTDLRIFDPSKVRALFEEKEAAIDSLRRENDKLRGDLEEAHRWIADVGDKENARANAAEAQVAALRKALESLKSVIEDLRYGENMEWPAWAEAALSDLRGGEDK